MRVGFVHLYLFSMSPMQEMFSQVSAAKKTNYVISYPVMIHIIPEISGSVQVIDKATMFTIFLNFPRYIDKAAKTAAKKCPRLGLRHSNKCRGVRIFNLSFMCQLYELPQITCTHTRARSNRGQYLDAGCLSFERSAQFVPFGDSKKMNNELCPMKMSFFLGPRFFLCRVMKVI